MQQGVDVVVAQPLARGAQLRHEVPAPRRSVDGAKDADGDGPGCGLGGGGERLHYWVFGGPWDYESSGLGEASGEDKAYLDEMTGANGAVIAGRSTYEAAGAWGGANPWDEIPSEAELRVAQAQLVGWLEGLFHGIQAAMFAQQASARAQFEELRRRGLPAQGPQDGPTTPENERTPGQYL